MTTARDNTKQTTKAPHQVGVEIPSPHDTEPIAWAISKFEWTTRNRKQSAWTCCKNNDGELGEPTAWHRRDGLFRSAVDFNWEEFKSSGTRNRSLISVEDVTAVNKTGSQKRGEINHEQ